MKAPYLLTFALIACLANSTSPDQNENCRGWAEAGECDKVRATWKESGSLEHTWILRLKMSPSQQNPTYMLAHCAASCDQVAAQALQDSKELEGIGSFFDLSANDIQGNELKFSKYRGHVVVVVNVASYCGYTGKAEL